MNTDMRAMALAVGICLLLGAATARAEDPLEQDMKNLAGKAFAKMLFATQAEARAECEAARMQLPPTAPQYLSAYVEACFGLTAAKTGPQKKPESCPYYQRAIDIWRDSPPPAANDEIALKFAGTLKQWKDVVAENCPPPEAAGTADKMAPVAVPEGATVKTLENISYVMPGGWQVRQFGEVGGFALFLNNSLQYLLRVERRPLNDDYDYAEREMLNSGHLFEWKHAPLIEGASGYYVFYARVKFDDAYVDIGISSSGPSDVGVDRDTALGIARPLAESIRVLGPRLCIADCGPGTITPAQ